MNVKTTVVPQEMDPSCRRPEPFLTLFIPGSLPRKSNSREIVHAKSSGQFDMVSDGGRTRVVAREKGSFKVRSKKSPQAEQYVRNFCTIVPGYLKKKYASPVVLSAIIAYRSVLSDLSVELLMDAIQESEILANDNQIRGYIDVFGYVDPANPGVLFSLYRLEDFAEHAARHPEFSVFGGNPKVLRYHPRPEETAARK